MMAGLAMQVMLAQVGSLADDSGRCVALMDVWAMPEGGFAR